MTFEQFKRAVIRLAKAQKVGHLVPNADRLYALWLAGCRVENVVQRDCTAEAQKGRHDEDTH